MYDKYTISKTNYQIYQHISFFLFTFFYIHSNIYVVLSNTFFKSVTEIEILTIKLYLC